MDEKTTPSSPEVKPDEAKSSPTPINSFSPPPDPIKFASPFSPSDQSKPGITKTPIDSLPKTDPVKDIAASLKTGSSADPMNEKSGLDSIKSGGLPAEKKSNTGLFVTIAIILVIAASIITGIVVYSWQSTLRDPLQKDKAMLQSQVGKLQSQVDVLEKDKADLQAQLESANATAMPAAFPETPPAGNTVPTPATSSGAETPATPAPSGTPAPPPTPTPTPGQ